MPLVNMKPLLRDAMDNGYAVAAFNLVDYGTTKAMIKAAEELKAPVIVQVSTKTIKFYSHEEIFGWVKTVGLLFERVNHDEPRRTRTDACTMQTDRGREGTRPVPETGSRT